MEIVITQESLGNEPLPAGVYVVKVEKVEFVQSSQKGTPGVSLQLRVLSPEEHAGRMAFDRLWLGDDPSKVLWRWNSLYKAATGEDLPKRSFTLDEFINLFTTPPVLGSVVLAELEVEEYEGNQRNRVRRFAKVKGE